YPASRYLTIVHYGCVLTQIIQWRPLQQIPHKHSPPAPLLAHQTYPRWVCDCLSYWRKSRSRIDGSSVVGAQSLFSFATPSATTVSSLPRPLSATPGATALMAV